MIYALLILFILVPGLLIGWWLISILRVFRGIDQDAKNDLTGTSDR